MPRLKTLLDAADAADYLLFANRKQPLPAKEKWLALIAVLVLAACGGLVLRLFF